MKIPSAHQPIQAVLHPEHAHEVMEDPEKWAIFVRCATDFRYFLNYWKFQDVDGGDVHLLGKQLWPGQEKAVRVMMEDQKVYFLKARQLGYTTLGCAYDAWCLRFRLSGGRVHVFSKRAKLAADLKWRVAFGLKRLPEWMQLPVGKDNEMEIELIANRDDIRTLEAYPSDEETGVGQTCQHAHIDEWWRMGNPRKVWQAIEPSIAPNATAHIITTGLGREGYPAEFWLKSLDEKSGFKAFFTSAFGRPDRTPDFIKHKEEEIGVLERKWEYPETWEDALAGAAGVVFAPADVAAARVNAVGPQPPLPGHKYIAGWDIGRHGDATVGIVLDITKYPYQVVHYERHKKVSYNNIAVIIENVHRAYRPTTVIEDNNAGEAVREFLDIPKEEVVGYKTTSKSKPKAISALQLAFSNRAIKYSANDWPQLNAEIATYTWEDKDKVQDSVIALAIANDWSIGALHLQEAGGRILDVISW